MVTHYLQKVTRAGISFFNRFFKRSRKHLCDFFPSQFQEMIDKLRPSWNQRLAAKKVSGRPSLSLEEELFMLLIYYRAYVTMERLGIYFHLDKANVSRHKKRKRGQALSSEEREHNRKVGKERIKVEHVFGRLKNWKILGGCYRNHLNKLGLRFSIMCGLCNMFLA